MLNRAAFCAKAKSFLRNGWTDAPWWALVLVSILLWLAYLGAMALWLGLGPDGGAFGDSFGGLNAFSAILAAVLLIRTLELQAGEFRQMVAEYRESKEQLAASARAQAQLLDRTSQGPSLMAIMDLRQRLYRLTAHRIARVQSMDRAILRIKDDLERTANAADLEMLRGRVGDAEFDRDKLASRLQNGKAALALLDEKFLAQCDAMGITRATDRGMLEAALLAELDDVDIPPRIL